MYTHINIEKIECNDRKVTWNTAEQQPGRGELEGHWKAGLRYNAKNSLAKECNETENWQMKILEIS